MLDLNGNVASWNKGAQRIKGYAANEIIGKHFSIFPIRRRMSQPGKPARELEIVRQKGSVEDEGWRVKKDRSLFWANVVITAIYDNDKRLIGYAKVTRDMTEKRKVEALEAADRQKNEFLAMLAHELRNPLAPIRNGLQILKVRNLDPVTAQQTTEMMERQVLQLVRLVDDLLDVSRVITGKLSFQKSVVDIAGVIQRAVEEAHAAIDARGHELMLSLPARPLLIDADVDRLVQVITNLLENAAKYTDTPSQIWLSVSRQGESAVIRVKDVGIGIAPEVLPDIFNLFIQADNSVARPRGGLGIGLNVVKRIVELHGGTVEASSPGLGQGTEFTVRLPISLAPAPTSAGDASLKQEVMKTTRRRILVVDDNVDAAVTIAALLQTWGHDVQAAYGGEAALEKVRSFQPEIVLLDIGMPGMTGYEVAKRLRAEPSAQGMIIVALTGYGQDADRERLVGSRFRLSFHEAPRSGPARVSAGVASIPKILNCGVLKIFEAARCPRPLPSEAHPGVACATP